MARRGGGVENSPGAKLVKVRLRARALDWIGAGGAKVLEGYAGNGAMWRAVWNRASESVGVDRRDIWDARRTLYVAELERVLRAIDLARFNVFDLDAFGSPWPSAWILSGRRKLAAGERVAVVFTDGASLKARFGGCEAVFAHLAGADASAPGAHVPSAYAMRTRQAMTGLARRMGGRVVWEQVEAGKGGKGLMTYSACGLEGVEP